MKHPIKVLASLVAISATWPMTASSASQMLPGDAVIEPVVNYQTAPAIAHGGDSSLAVWVDTRANPYTFMYSWGEYETSHDIYAVRLDATGNVLDAVPIAVVAERAIQDRPKVAWNGANWLVVYESVDLNGTGYYYQDSLEAVRVSPAGLVLDAKPIKLYGLTPSSWTVASDGNNWVVANVGTSAGSDVVAVRISPGGVVLDMPMRTLVRTGNYLPSNLKLAFAGGIYMLTYWDNNVYGTWVRRLDGNLNFLDPAPIQLLDTPLSDLAANGGGLYAVWHRQEQDGLVHVFGSRVSTAGVVLDGAGINLSGAREPAYDTTTAVAWDGVNWRITWGEVNTAYVARVTSAGVVLDPGSVAVAGPRTGPTAGTGTGALHVVWSVFTNNSYDVFTANISPVNAAGPNRPLPLGTPQQTRSDVAASGNGYMVVYRSTTATTARILAQPLDAAGNPLTAEPVELESGSSYNGPGSPNVAWNGSVYLVSWTSTNGVIAQRLSPSGAEVDPAPFMVMTGCFGPADVAALSSDFLVGGRKVGVSAQYIFPVAARVSGAGALLDATPLVVGGSYLRTAPAVVALGGQWLVVWHQNATHDNSSATTQGAFVPPTGAPTAAFQIHGPFSTAGGNGIFEVGLASSGNQALMVQSQELTSGVENDLLCRVIAANGTVGPQTNLTPWEGNQYRPRAAWDGTNFIIAYQEQKNRLAPWTLDQLDARSDLFAMRVSAAGTKIDPQGFVFSASPTGETDPNVAALNGVTMLTGSVVANDSTHANYRIVYDQRGIGGNKWPVAVATASPAAGDVPMTAAFTSAGSSDPDGMIVSYFWDFGDGASTTQANPSHDYMDAGPYVARLTVTDDAGAATTQTVLVKAVAPNQLPVAEASADTYAGVLPLDVVCFAAGSYDPDGFIGNIEWLFSDGGSYWGATAYHTFTEPGPQTVTLNCYDARGGVGTTRLIINADGVNRPPVAVAGATPTSGYTPLAVQFSSAGSWDSDGTIVGYQWTFGDGAGSTSNEANPAFTYVSSGSYTATLTVWDDQNDSATDTVEISVGAQHYVEYGVNLSLGPHYIEQYEQGEQSVGPIDREDVIAGYGRVAGIANVGFGVNKARVDLSGTNPANPLFFEYGFATSRYWDVFQFDHPDLNGTHGFFDVTLFVAGAGFVNLRDGYLQSPDTEFDAFWHAVINVSVEGVTDPIGNPIQSVYYAGEWYKGYESTTLDYFGDPLNSYQQTATIEFIYGQPISVDTFLQVDTNFDNQTASVAGTLDTVIDLGNSSYWGGVRNLRDAQGHSVTTAGYTSSSGFDYRQSALPTTPGDMDGDGDVDLGDYAKWAACMTGPGGIPAGSCSGADIDGEGDVDLGDYALIQAAW